MNPPLRRAMPVLLAAVAFTSVGCESRVSQRTPTAPQAAVGGEEGRLSAMAVAPSLGAADPFGVLAATAVTNTGFTVIGVPIVNPADLGLSPNGPASITGFPPGIVTGTTHAGNATAALAQDAITTAYNQLAGQPCDVDLTGV